MKPRPKTPRRRPRSRSIATCTCFAESRSSAPGRFPSPATKGLGRLRKTETRREDSLDALTDDQTGDFTPAILTSWREVPSQALEQKELAALLRQAIDGLPEIYRNVVLLRDIEEMDVRETAAALGITEGAVKVRLHRARALLQRSLAPRLKGFAPRRAGLFGWANARKDESR